MEREGNAAADGAGRWEASPDGVIVLPAGSAAAASWQPQHRHHHHHQREQEQQVGHGSTAGAGAGVLGEFPEPPEKVFYKTKLCERFEAGGRCVYEDGCTFAHGHAELRPPLPVPPALVKRRQLLAAAEQDSGRDPATFHGGGKVCFEFRDKGTCHWGAKCAYAHASAAEAAEMRYPGGPRPGEPARRSATLPARAFSPGPAAGAMRGGSSYAQGTARAFSPVPAAAGEDDAKVSRLELLSRRKMSGIYGDWPEED